MDQSWTTNPRNPRYEISTHPEKGLEICYITHGFKGVEPYQQQEGSMRRVVMVVMDLDSSDTDMVDPNRVPNCANPFLTDLGIREKGKKVWGTSIVVSFQISL